MAAAFSVRKLAESRGLELELEVVLELAADDWEEMELAEELEKLPTEFVSCLYKGNQMVKFGWKKFGQMSRVHLWKHFH